MSWIERVLACDSGRLASGLSSSTRSAPTREALEAWTDPILETLCADLQPEDAEMLREERAAILEFEAGLERHQADRKAGLRPGRQE
jgi:hypothetical protein